MLLFVKPTESYQLLSQKSYVTDHTALNFAKKWLKELTLQFSKPCSIIKSTLKVCFWSQIWLSKDLHTQPKLLLKKLPTELSWLSQEPLFQPCQESFSFLEDNLKKKLLWTLAPWTNWLTSLDLGSSHSLLEELYRTPVSRPGLEKKKISRLLKMLWSPEPKLTLKLN